MPLEFDVVGISGISVQRLDANMAKADLLARVFGTVQLEPDKAGPAPGIVRVGRRHAVQPGLYGVLDGLDPKLIPLTLFEGFSRGLVVLERLKPASATCFVHAAAPGSLGRIDFDLIAKYLSDVEGPGYQLELSAQVKRRRLLLVNVGANMDPRVEPLVDLEFEFQNEVVEGRIRTQVAALHTGSRFTDDGAVLDGEFPFSLPDGPAVQCLSVEQRLPPVVRSIGGNSKRWEDQKQREQTEQDPAC